MTSNAAQHPHHDHHEPASGGTGEPALAELLDLDAEVLHAHLSEVTAWVAGLAGDGPCRRIVDVGAGTGTGAFALLERFDGSEVTLVDVSAGMLGRARDEAARRGLADRVRPVQADLDAPWPALGPADLVWAAASMHHLADPDRALSEALAVLRPGGLLAVVELEGFPRFLPDDAGPGRPGLEARCHAALAAARAARLPDRGGDWATRLVAAGSTLVAERVFPVDLAPPLPAATRRYARACLRGMRAGLAGLLDAEDLAALDALLDDDGPHSVLQREDLVVRTSRTGWVARRP